MPRDRRNLLLLSAATALIALLPFARGLLAGQCFFFRDLSGALFPWRMLGLEGLRQGEIRFWNPYVHEGEPSLPALCYPFDLLQLLVSGEWGLSLVLALHIAFAAVAFAALLRGWGRRPLPAAAGGLLYAWGGFALSTINLYIYAEALPWIPLVILGLKRTFEGQRRAIAWAALALALAATTLGFELVAQAVVLGLVLGWPERDGLRRLPQVGAALALAAGLAAPVLVFMLNASGSGERGSGLAAPVVVAQHIHPFGFLQVLIGNLFGNLANPANEWWGANFFTQGFPYILSLYWGAAVVTLAVCGLVAGAGLPRWRLLLAGLGAVWICLGPYAGLEQVVGLSPWLRVFRFPVKAYFTLHLLVAFAAASGLEALALRARRAWATALVVSATLGALLFALTWLPALLPRAGGWFVGHFFPPGTDLTSRLRSLAAILADARLGGLVALLLALTAVLVLARRLEPRRAALLAGALALADLLRAGVGLNPTVTPSFYRLSPEAAALAARLREADARVFTCDLESVPDYFRARAQRPFSHDAWTFTVFRESFTPYFNVTEHVRSGLSWDKTMSVPVERVLHPRDAACSAVPRIVPRLRQAGVSHVLSFTPQSHPDLDLLDQIANASLAPLTLYVYALRQPLPRLEVARWVTGAVAGEVSEWTPPSPGTVASEASVRGPVRVTGFQGVVTDARGEILARTEGTDELRATVDVDRPTVVVVRDAFSAGWHAEIDGRPAPLLRADGRHRAVPVPAGRSEVRLVYRPQGLVASLAVSLLALAGVAALLLYGSRGLRLRPASGG